MEINLVSAELVSLEGVRNYRELRYRPGNLENTVPLSLSRVGMSSILFYFIS